MLAHGAARSVLGPPARRPPRPSAPTLVGLASLILLLLGALGLRRAQADDSVDELARTLERERNVKARIAAAISLGRMADPRAMPALIRALGDRHPVVRGVAAAALGHLGDARAVPSLERALGDENAAVRRRVRKALETLKRHASGASTTPSGSGVIKPKERPRLGPKGDGPFVRVALAKVASAAPSASPQMARLMEDYVRQELARSPEVTLEKRAGGDLPSYVLDGSIIELTREARGPWIDTRCQVKLTVSTSEGRIVSIVSGAATVQTPRQSYRARAQGKISAQALENAVRGAHRNLIGFLTRQVASLQ